MGSNRRLSVFKDATPQATEYAMISHDDEEARLIAHAAVSHSEVGDQSWHNYSRSQVTGLQGVHQDVYSRPVNSRGILKELPDHEDYLNSRPGRDRPLFTSGQSNSNPFTTDSAEGDPRVSKMDYLRTTKEGRWMVPTMLGLAQFDVKERLGHNLASSTDLSAHSAPMVDRLRKAGLVTSNVPENAPTPVTNELTFERPMWHHDVESLIGKMGMGSMSGSHMTQVHRGELDRGRRAGKAIVRTVSGRTQSFTQGSLF